MPKVHANRVNLHYITVGTGPDIVMLNGFLGNLAISHLYMAPILQRDFRVTTYDLRGHGYSDLTRGTQAPIGIVEASPGLFYAQDGGVQILSVTASGNVAVAASFPDPPYIGPLPYENAKGINPRMPEYASRMTVR
jgi:pimeloyl-ACP methyl ester carboxylesterase